MKKQINEIKRMQQLAGIITESEYQESLSEETNEETLDDVTFTLDMALNNMFPMYGFKAGDTVTGILPAEEFADETKRNSAEDFQAAQAYIKNKGGEIKINSSDPYLMFRNINITYKLKDNGDIEYAVEVPAKKIDEAKKRVISKYINVEIEDGEEYPTLNKKAIADYLKSVIDPSELKSVNMFMRDEEGFDESSMHFDIEDNTTEQEIEDWAKQEMSYYLYSSPDEFPGKELNENISDEAIDRMEGLANTHHLSTLKFSLENLVPEWIQDGGFDEDDVIDYLTHLVRNSY